MTEEQEAILREVLHGRPQVFPATLYGLLGGDPNDFTIEEYAVIADWLHRLGYVRRVRPRFLHAHLVSVWVRDDIWPGEELGLARPYAGIPLKPDPELRLTREEKRERIRRFDRYLSGM